MDDKRVTSKWGWKLNVMHCVVDTSTKEICTIRLKGGVGLKNDTQNRESLLECADGEGAIKCKMGNDPAS